MYVLSIPISTHSSLVSCPGFAPWTSDVVQCGRLCGFSALGCNTIWRDWKPQTRGNSPHFTVFQVGDIFRLSRCNGLVQCFIYLPSMWQKMYHKVMGCKYLERFQSVSWIIRRCISTENILKDCSKLFGENWLFFPNMWQPYNSWFLVHLPSTPPTLVSSLVDTEIVSVFVIDLIGRKGGFAVGGNDSTTLSINNGIYEYNYFFKINIYIYILYDILIKGSLEVKLPTLWRDEKQREAESERREE